ALHESALEKKALGFGEIPLEPDNERQVAEAEDITDQMLKPPEETKPSLPYAKVRLLKGALNSFQAWQAKSSKCMGVILGRQAGANFDGLKIIVSCDHSLTELVGHEKVVQLCQQEKLVPCGLILGEDKNRPEIETLLDNMVTKAPAAVCIFVNITCYGDISLFQTEPQLEAFAGRTPTFARAPKDLLGNLTWLNDLFVTNKERLKGKVEDAIIRSALKEPCREKTTSIKRPVAYKQIHVAGDGRCGWRAIKAFEDIKR
ncbi:unnamed protein product, partial [Durusdinium trenchii]